MLPEGQDGGLVLTLLPADVQHALPDTRQITQVEDVVELGWGR